MKAIFTLTAAAAAAAILAAGSTAGRVPVRWPIPDTLYAQALCVHSGWNYEAARGAKARRRLSRRLGHGPDYFNGPTAFYRTFDVPDSIRGGSGEGGWTTVNGYGGGMQMILSTYQRAARLSRGRLPYLTSDSAVADLPPGAQIYAAVLIVESDGGSWREWPETSVACGLR